MKFPEKFLKPMLLTVLIVCMAFGATVVFAEDLLVYTALEDDEIPHYLAVLKKDHPDINLKIVRDSTGIVTAKLPAEKDNPRADVAWGTAATGLMLCDQAGTLVPYAPKGLEKVVPNMRDFNNPPHWADIKA